MEKENSNYLNLNDEQKEIYLYADLVRVFATAHQLYNIQNKSTFVKVAQQALDRMQLED